MVWGCFFGAITRKNINNALDFYFCIGLVAQLGLERIPPKDEVEGSNPSGPVLLRKI